MFGLGPPRAGDAQPAAVPAPWSAAAATQAVQQASGRENRPAVRTGWRLETGLSYGRPMFDADGRAQWQRVGSFRPGGGAALGAGYDWSRVGATVAIDVAGSRVGGRNAGVLSAALLAHWRPAVALGHSTRAWQPRLTAGYVRQGVFGAQVTRSDLAADLAARVGDDGATPTTPSNLAVIGNGVRVGAAAERTLTGRLALSLGATLDVVSFGTATYEGIDYSLERAGRGVHPRGVAAVVWRPF